MSSIWMIGDVHLYHAKVTKIRGFSTLEDHNKAIMDAWFKVVRPDDQVYVMGDISSGKNDDERRALSLLYYLPGRKRLITGNHDSVAGIHRAESPNISMFRDVFKSINDYGRIKMERHQVLLSHYPYLASGDGPTRGPARYEEFRLADRGSYLIHAHTHHTDPFDGSATGREMCVSWDAWGRMVGVSDISKWLKSKEQTDDHE